MAGPKNHKPEPPIMENGEIKLQKKQKNKQKRKLEETDAEFAEEKVEEQTPDAGTAEIPKKKKKKKGKADGGEGDLSSAPSEESGRKKKKKKSKVGEGGDGAIESKGGEAAKEEVIEGTGVVVSGKNVNESKYKALDSFAESGLPDDVLECCKAFDKPSPIQAYTWPFLLDGRDLIGIAATGSGTIFIVVQYCSNLASFFCCLPMGVCGVVR